MCNTFTKASSNIMSMQKQNQAANKALILYACMHTYMCTHNRFRIWLWFM